VTESRGRRSISKRDRERFLAHLAAGGTAREAARVTGRNFTSFYALRRTDDEFARQWDEAVETGTEVLEGEATRRAVDGYVVTRYNPDGSVAWTEHRHDNGLLQFLLKGRKPEVYRDGPQVDVGPINFRIVSAFEPPAEEIEGELVAEDGLRELEEGSA